MEEQLESLLEILLEILPRSTGQLETIQATKKLPKTNTSKMSLKIFETIRVETCHFPYLKNHTSTIIKSNFLCKNPIF